MMVVAFIGMVAEPVAGGAFDNCLGILTEKAISLLIGVIGYTILKRG